MRNVDIKVTLNVPTGKALERTKANAAQTAIDIMIRTLGKEQVAQLLNTLATK